VCMKFFCGSWALVGVCNVIRRNPLLTDLRSPHLLTSTVSCTWSNSSTRRLYVHPSSTRKQDTYIANFLEIVTVKEFVKIGQYLTKLWVEHLDFTFLAHPVGYVYDNDVKTHVLLVIGYLKWLTNVAPRLFHPICAGKIYTTCATRVVLFSVVSVCLVVCLFVSQHDNSWTVRDIITKFSRHHSTVKRADKFENG